MVRSLRIPQIWSKFTANFLRCVQKQSYKQQSKLYLPPSVADVNKGLFEYDSCVNDIVVVPCRPVYIVRCFGLSYDTRALQPVATCRQPPYLRKPAILSLRRHAHCDVICCWAGHAQRYGRRPTLRTDTLPRLIYKDFKLPLEYCNFAWRWYVTSSVHLWRFTHIITQWKEDNSKEKIWQRRSTSTWLG